MRWFRNVLAVTTLFVLASPGWAAGQRDYDDCNQFSDPDRRIAGCARILGDRKESVSNRIIAHYNRGIAWRAKGDYDRAIADFSDAIRLNPNLVDGYAARSIALNEKRDYARAISDVTRAMQLRGKASYEDYVGRAISYRLAGNPSAALDDIRSAGSAYPDKRNASYYHQLGLNLHLLGRYDEAIEVWTSLVAEQPPDYWAYFRRGASYDKQGNRSKALEDLKKAAANIDAQHWNDEAKIIFAQYELQSPTGAPIDAQGLAGSYDLYSLTRYRQGRELPSASNRIVVTAGDGNTIQVRSPSDITKPEFVWEGTGKLQGKTGYYDWKFGDGKNGRTDFVLTADNDIIGYVQISDPARKASFNWWYLGKRRP